MDRQQAHPPDAPGAATRIMALETKIALAHATREESEDFAKGAQVWTRADLEKKAPGIDWGALLNANTGLLLGAAIIALPSVVLMMIFGQTRILFAMGRDNNLPGGSRLASVSGSRPRGPSSAPGVPGEPGPPSGPRPPPGRCPRT